MPDILTQEEIDALLDVVEDEDEHIDYGSPEFEKLIQEYRSNLSISNAFIELNGNNPTEIINDLQRIDEEFILIQKAYTQHKIFKDKFLKLLEEQPEIFL